MKSKKEKKTVSSRFRRQKIIERLIDVPSSGIRAFWGREMALFNRLLKKYPIEFWEFVSFDQKFPSLAVFFSDGFIKPLKNKYHAFSYVPPEIKQPEIFDTKFGDDAKITKKPITLKDFLTNGKTAI